MTIEQYIKDRLIASGMFDNAAVQIIERLKAKKAMESMKTRWQDNIEGYPKSVLVAIWICAEDVALDWIDEFLPLAWNRPLFVHA